MGYQRHIIGRTVLELDSGTVADVWELQETMSRLLQNRAISDLEALFDDLATADEVIRFDHVEVDLGEFSPYALDEEFVPVLVRALREKLCDRILQAQLQNQAQSQLDEAPNHQNQASADWEVVIYFLQYGRLPWWQAETRWSTWQTRWQAVIANSSSWQQPLLQCLAKGSAAQRRLISQVPKDFCHQLIRQLHPSGEMGLTLMAHAHQLAVSLGLKPSFQALLDDVAIYLVFDELAAIAAAAAFPTLRWLSRWLASLQQRQSVQTTVLFSRSARMRQWMSNVHQ